MDDNDDKFRQTIREMLFAGRSLRALTQLAHEKCCECRIDKRFGPVNEMIEWVKNAEQVEQPKLPELSEKACPELKIVKSEYQQYKRAFEGHKCVGTQECRIILLSECYSVEIYKIPDKPTFYLYDNLHGEKRNISTTFQFPDNESYFKLSSFKSNQFFVFTDTKFCFETREFYKDESFVYLLELDVVKMQVSLVDKQKMNDYYNQTVVDFNDPSKFIFSNKCDSIQKACLVEGKLEIGNNMSSQDLEQSLTDEPYMYWKTTFKLEDDMLYALCSRRGDSNETYKLIKAKICSDKIGPVQSFDFEAIESNYSRKVYDYVWFSTKCYLLGSYGFHQSNLYVLDTITLKAIPIKFLAFGHKFAIKGLLVENNVLTVCGTKCGVSQHYWKKIPVENPVKLVDLAMQSIHYRTTFMKTDEYSTFVQLLPPNLRPFGQH